MLRTLKDLGRYSVSATDGDVGTASDFLLDDQYWTVRYLVVDPGGYLDGRRVLISPISFRQIEPTSNQFHLALTIDKIKNSPSIDLDKPVSRQHERDYNRYYGYPYYWGYSGNWGANAYPGLTAADMWNPADKHADEAPNDDVHLRSAREISGYHIQGSDAAIGHVEDFIVDDRTWEVRYLVVDTSNWWFGKRVLVAPLWANRVSWAERKVYVDISRRLIKSSPDWNPSTAVTREYEARLHDHYGRVARQPAGASPP